MRVSNETDSRVFKFSNDLAGVVVRSVIDHDQLKILVSLFKDARNCPSKKLMTVTRRNDDAYCGQGKFLTDFATTEMSYRQAKLDAAERWHG
jgi:hypothetical protein